MNLLTEREMTKMKSSNVKLLAVAALTLVALCASSMWATGKRISRTLLAEL